MVLQTSNVNTAGGYGQLIRMGAAELYAGILSLASVGVHCCANSTFALCVTLFADPSSADGSLAASNPTSYALSVAAASKKVAFIKLIVLR